MIDGLTATWASNTDTLKEIELRQTASETRSDDEALVLSVILVVGPPDPNALSYLVPRAVFERGLPVHVGALLSPAPNAEDQGNELLDAMLDILEVMNPHDIVVFICDTPETLAAAVSLMEP
ncbi:MAG: hypothetical protein LRY53_10095 [Burkholderiaceae bacterium]|nr:hypothetical protein [Burkholderiaceae bacterium]MCD8537471.1 hypothetical protein [Burkholderiaceae bacterium]MCD8565956.1 hypothetical protein [Burkholderiaceae bacterium]